MASSGLARLALKPTSRMSLNERFQQLRQKQTLQQTNASKSNKSAQNASRLELRQGSQKNRRLALQMANRPSVLAALKANQNTAPKSRPITQRLGIKRVFNKSIPTNQNRNQNKTGFRLNRNFNANRIGNNRHNMAIKANNRRKANNTNSQNIGVSVGVKRKGLQRNRLRRNVKQVSNATGFKGKRKVGQQMRNQNQAKGVVKKGFRINRNFNARTTQGKPMKRRNVKPNKDQLDKDLDAYMAKTKSHLDAELDAYMSQTN